ncbi:hypothetical protein JCM10207_002501 [Rhodosporidiobolus poonsookiae]
MLPRQWPHQANPNLDFDPALAHPGASHALAERAPPDGAWDGHQHVAGYPSEPQEQLYETVPPSSLPPYSSPYQSYQQPHPALHRRPSMPLTTIRTPTPQRSGAVYPSFINPHHPPPTSSVVTSPVAYSSAPSTHAAYVDAASTLSRKRGFEESLGGPSYSGGVLSEEAQRYRPRIPSGRLVPPVSASAAYSYSPVQQRMSSVEVASPVASPALPHHQPPSPYYEPSPQLSSQHVASPYVGQLQSHLAAPAYPDSASHLRTTSTGMPGHLSHSASPSAYSTTAYSPQVHSPSPLAYASTSRDAEGAFAYQSQAQRGSLYPTPSYATSSAASFRPMTAPNPTPASYYSSGSYPSYPDYDPPQVSSFPRDSPTSAMFVPASLATRPSTSAGSPTEPEIVPASTSGPPASPPRILPETLPALQQASSERAVHRTSAPILAFNPAREPASTAKQLVQSEFGVTYAIASSGSSRGKAKSAEVIASCWTCGKQSAKVILRGSDLTGFAPRLTFTCLDCLPNEQREEDNHEARMDRLAARAEAADRVALGLEEEPPSEAGGSVAGGSVLGSVHGSPGAPMPRSPSAAPSASSVAQMPDILSPSAHDKATFKDTFSGAVDYLEGKAAAGAQGARSRLLLPPEQTGKGLPAHVKRQALTCDVCDRIIGAGSISSLTPAPVPTFTVEVICLPCSDKYRPCSDCGGGGGRLTPGRWRCKELFPAGRRTCTLSHARNPPLDDIDYDVVRVTELDPAKLETLESRCRLIYYNTRMRTQARPEMLERADGLATTFSQCEKLVVDGWSLLKPLLSHDIEGEHNIRRYVGIQTSTPHRRRAKPKAGAPPKPDPDEESAEKEVSGFLLVEHDFEKGAIFIAVTMPWAIAGDAFDATTVLMDHTFKRVRADVHQLNAARALQDLAPYPEPWCVWGITPFKADSRMTQSLSRRGLGFLEDYVKEHPEVDMTCFPPHREIHIPTEFVKTFKIFIRSVTAEDGVGAPPTSVGGKGSIGKANKIRKAAKAK